jgi:hypothetical protein
LRFFRGLDKRRKVACDSCHLEFEIVTEQPSIGELLTRVNDLSYLFLCESCGKKLCTRCLSIYNPTIDVSKRRGENLKHDTFLCYSCGNRQVHLSNFGFITTLQEKLPVENNVSYEDWATIKKWSEELETTKRK